MYKTAGWSLGLGLCLLIVGAHFALPHFRVDVTGPLFSTPDPASLAILAPTPTPVTAGVSPSAVQDSLAVRPPNLATGDDNATAWEDPGDIAAAGSALRAALAAPTLAPGHEAALLPTVTPTPLPMLPPPLPTAQIVAPSEAPTAVPVSQPEVPLSAPPAAAVPAVADGCWIASPPPGLGLDPFYSKYCSAQGIPIVAAGSVPDAALQQAWQVVTQMLGSLAQAESIRTSITGMSTRIGIIGATQVTTDMPEHRSLYTLFPDIDWNTRARGVGATPQIPLLSVAEENLLCYANDLWAGQNVLVHEFAHTIKNMGLDIINPGFHAELQRAYQAALDGGLWSQTYVASSVEEYWAEGVRLYFQTEAAGVPAGQAYPAQSRAELQRYDPELYGLVASIFTLQSTIPPCPVP